MLKYFLAHWTTSDFKLYTIYEYLNDRTPYPARPGLKIIFISNHVTELLLFSGLQINDLFIIMWQLCLIDWYEVERDFVLKHKLQ